MTTETEHNGGPAFPSGLVENAADEVDSLHKGMALRDYFAAKALQGFLADPKPFNDLGKGIAMSYAIEAYVYADAMLKAREA